MKTFEQALQYLYATIPKTQKTKYPADLGLCRMKRIMDILGNPQNNLRIIHIAGTSGKGSTATLLSALLTAGGKKIGLHVKPHFIDIRERLQINNFMISKKEFIDILIVVKTALAHLEEDPYGKATYFEILVAVAYIWFTKQKVDYAVIETGVGGMFDGTNVIERKDKVCVITKIGLDHTAILGKTTTAIAKQKAGIIQPHNAVLSCDQTTIVRNTLNIVAAKNQTVVTCITTPTLYKNVHVSPEGTTFLYKHNGSFVHFELKTIGQYQAQNASLALATIQYVCARDKWQISLSSLKNTLLHTAIQGRFEVIDYKGKKLILDSAHNPQKMNAFVKTLQKVYPNEKKTFCIAVKNDKDSQTMLNYCTQCANHIIITEFAFDTVDIPQLSSLARELYAEIPDNKKNICIIEPNQKKALEKAISSEPNIVIVTGSMYLLAAIKHILQKENILHK